MTLAGIWRAIIFSKIVMNRSVSLPQRTIKPRPICGECQFLANEADNFLAQCVARARPCFRTAKMLYTKLQRRKPKVVDAGFDQSIDSLFQETEKCKFVAGNRTISDIHKRKRNRWGCGQEDQANHLTAVRLPRVAHGALTM